MLYETNNRHERVKEKQDSEKLAVCPIHIMLSADQILSFAENFSFYFVVAIFIVGCIGNLLNLCAFLTLKIFRSNQCVFYLIVESIVDTCQLLIILIIYLLPLFTGVDIGNMSLIWCKLKNVLPQTLRLLSTSMVCLAALDQFLSTNPRHSIQNISSLRLAHRVTFVAVCLWIIHGIPYGIFYQIVPSNGCIITNIKLTQYYIFFYYPILHGLLPIATSSLLSLFAFRNVRHLVRRQMPIVRRKLDRQLTAMIFTRVICFVSFLLPYTVYRIISFNIAIDSTSPYLYAINQLISSILTCVSDLNYLISFYIFVASSTRYRRQVKHFLVKKCWRSLKSFWHIDSNEVHPMGAESIQ